jgi:hypothetical protein
LRNSQFVISVTILGEISFELMNIDDFICILRKFPFRWKERNEISLGYGG